MAEQKAGTDISWYNCLIRGLIVSFSLYIQTLWISTIYRVIALLLIISLSPLLLKTFWTLYILYQFPKDPGFTSELPPGSLGYPIVGESLHYLIKYSDFLKERRALHGAIYKTHLLGHPTIRVSGADNLRVILNGENDIVTAHWPQSTRTLLGNGALSTMTGNAHDHRKCIVMPAFRQSALEDYIPPALEVLGLTLTSWVKQSHIYGYLAAKELTFTLSSKILIGFDLDEKEIRDLSKVFGIFVDGMFSIPYKFPGSTFSKSLKSKEIIGQKISHVVADFRKHGSHFGFQTVFNRIVTADGADNIADSELVETVVDLLFAGHDTTSIAICSTLMLLGKHPESLERLRGELRQHGLMDPDKPVTFHDVHAMPYLNSVIKEILRLLPPVGGAFRRVLKTFELGEYQIPKGWGIVCGFRENLTDPAVYRNSEKFQPERWMQELSHLEKEIKYQYLPFGYGGRACVGREFAKLILRLFLVEACRRCDWQLVNPDPKMKFIPITKAADNLPLIVREHRSM